MNAPCGLVANTRDGWSGITAVTAISGSLRELPEHRFLSGAPRFRDSEPQDIRDWLRGVAAYTRLRRSRLLLWGGAMGRIFPSPARTRRPWSPAWCAKCCKSRRSFWWSGPGPSPRAARRG